MILRAISDRGIPKREKPRVYKFSHLAGITEHHRQRSLPVAALRCTGRCPTSERALTGVQVTETGILPTHALIDVVARGEPVLSTS